MVIAMTKPPLSDSLLFRLFASSIKIQLASIPTPQISHPF